MTWDGSDFRCNNRPNAKLVRKAKWKNLPFDPHYWSHKFNGAGLRYGIAICNQSGEMVGAHGLKPAGHWPDIKIFKNIHYLFFCLAKWLRLIEGYVIHIVVILKIIFPIVNWLPKRKLRLDMKLSMAG